MPPNRLSQSFRSSGPIAHSHAMTPTCPLCGLACRYTSPSILGGRHVNDFVNFRRATKSDSSSTMSTATASGPSASRASGTGRSTCTVPTGSATLSTW